MSINFIFCLVGKDLIYVQWTASIYELLALWLQVMFLKQNWIIDKNAISTVLYIFQDIINNRKSLKYNSMYKVQT